MSEELKQIIHGRTHIHIGKKGINQPLIDQITQQFKRNQYLKVRFLELGDFDSMQDAANSLINKLSAKLVDKRGNTVVIQRAKD